MIDLHGITQDCFDDGVGYEVSSREHYERALRGLTWPPAGNSGATCGIGYDLGQASRRSITVTVLGCTPQVRHDNYSDRHFEDDLWQYGERSVSFRGPRTWNLPQDSPRLDQSLERRWAGWIKPEARAQARPPLLAASKTNFSKIFNATHPVQPLAQKYSDFYFSEIMV